MPPATLIKTKFDCCDDAVSLSPLSEAKSTSLKYSPGTGAAVTPITTVFLEARVNFTSSLFGDIKLQVAQLDTWPPEVRSLEIDQEGPYLKDYRPKTSLGKGILSLRKLHVESGGKLLDWDQIEDEVGQM